jgi:hypothetical protein
MRHLDLCRFDYWKRFHHYVISSSKSSTVLIVNFIYFWSLRFSQLLGKKETFPQIIAKLRD